MTLHMLFISLSFLIALGDAQDCAALAAEGNCDFYPLCLEARIPCGNCGYALGFGEKYCRRFADELVCYTSEGQDWVNGVGKCLMQVILNSAIYNSDNATCKELLEFAFDSHPACYVNNGICTVILENLRNLLCLIGAFDFSDLLTKNGIRQVFDTAKDCAEDFISVYNGTNCTDTTGGGSVVHPLSLWSTSFIAFLVMIISFSGGKVI